MTKPYTEITANILSSMVGDKIAYQNGDIPVKIIKKMQIFLWIIFVKVVLLCSNH